MCGLFEDTKDPPDLTLLRPEEGLGIALADLDALLLEGSTGGDDGLDPATRPVPPAAAVAAFVARHFAPPPASTLHLGLGPPRGYDGPGPTALVASVTPPARPVARALLDVWPLICGGWGEDPPPARVQPGGTLRLPPGPFVVPGDRFREPYYWDSLWSIRGLVASGLADAARDATLTLARECLETGFVPNGGRMYYRRRSQPPVLGAAIEAAFLGLRPWGGTGGVGEGEPTDGPQIRTWSPAWLAASGIDRIDVETVADALEIELTHWGSGAKRVVVDAHDDATKVRVGGAADAGEPGRTAPVLLSRYRANSDCPRPEAYRWDLTVATGGGGRGDDDAPPATAAEAAMALAAPAARRVCRELSTAAESGWDFSTRWLLGTTPHTLAQTRCSRFLPTDLNAFLARAEWTLGGLREALGDAAGGDRWRAAGRRRAAAIHRLMWSSVSAAGGGGRTRPRPPLHRPLPHSAPLHSPPLSRPPFPADPGLLARRRAPR